MVVGRQTRSPALHPATLLVIGGHRYLLGRRPPDFNATSRPCEVCRVLGLAQKQQLEGERDGPK